MWLGDLMEGRQPQPRKPYFAYARLAEGERAELRKVARQLHLSVSATMSLLIAEALQARRDKAAEGPSNPEELQLHVLVGVEQVIALIESIHPRGPGVASQLLPQALAAAKERVTVTEPA